MKDIRVRSIDFSVYTLFAFLIILFHYPVVGSYWLFDDLLILRHAADHHPWEYFIMPRVWQELSASNLTPWVTLSFDIDFSLFGFKPEFFYIHHLCAIWGVLVMLYAVLRLWVPRLYAFWGSLLFFVSAPASLASELLTLRHYVEGSFWILMSLLLFVVSLRKKKFGVSCLSAISYFFAMTAKEIYVLFVLVIFFFPEERWSLRLKYSTPHSISFLSYILWRAWMLGRSIGGYHDELLNSGFLSEVHRFFVTNTTASVKMLAGISSISAFVHFTLLVLTGIVLIAALLVYMRRRFPGVIFIAVLLVSVYAPISPAFISLSPDAFETYRFLYLFSLIYSSLIAVLTYQLSLSGHLSSVSLRAKQIILLLLLVFVTALIFLSSYEWLTVQREIVVRPLAAEGRFLMDADPKSVMVKTFVMTEITYYESMDYFRMKYRKHHIPTVVYDVFLEIDNNAVFDLSDVRVYKYRRDKGMVEITKEFAAKRGAYLASLVEQPFYVRLEVKKGRFDYMLGPSDIGRYFALAGYRPGNYTTFFDSLPRRWPSVAFLGKTKWYMRFGWRSPQGRTTLSPEWHIDFSKDQEIYWSQK